jgi:YegS/Rv2252/BmrU family lipid kinase
MSRRILYFINPISGTKDKQRLLELISHRTKKAGIDFEILNTIKSGDYSFLPEKITTEKITDIVICGGDGTISNITSYIKGLSVNVGIIPMGSGNGLAFAAGISRNPKKALEIIFDGKSRWIDGFTLNNYFSIMLSGLGFDAQVAHDFSQQKKRGLFIYIIQATKNFFKTKNYPFSIEVNNHTIHVEAFFICIANSNQFGNNVTIAPLASLSDGLLDIIIVTKMNKIKTMFLLFKHIFQGKAQENAGLLSSKKGIIYIQSTKVKITNSLKAPLHVDGEPVESSEIVEVKIIPNAIKLVQPI